jgi:hypothetical protein
MEIRKLWLRGKSNVPRCRRALKPIGLLVVIAILAAMLAPAPAKAKQGAWTADIGSALPCAALLGILGV